ncbi:trace amine-associated receptor 13c-like [Cyclopterus lumpus]|uniref:trace amine-associated receptor 13c-like n=1 Tax=Cyclopterus lumpus TaxID=8103 RepID=UPI001485E1A7|nr:trace amine-associated receptor 13c-like [Cyclopterus lumpus]
MEAEDGSELCFPQLQNTSCRKPTLLWHEALLPFFLMSISTLTVALNLLVIISVSHFRKLHTPTNILILSLAVSDLIVGLLLLPVEIILKLSCWFLGDLACSLFNYVSFIVTSASVGNMVLISMDRYMSICDPLHYTARVTVNRVRLCVCMCWLGSVSYSAVFARDSLTQPGKYNSCHGECVVFIDYVSGAVDVVLTCALPVTVIIVLYARVFSVAVAQARAMRSQISVVSVGLKMMRSELKAARTLGVVVVLFLICFCPYYAVSLVSDSLVSSSYVSFVLYLFYLNSFLNPLIYALFYPWFRKAIKRIVILQAGS